ADWRGTSMGSSSMGSRRSVAAGGFAGLCWRHLPWGRNMTRQATLELVQRYYDAFNRGDWARMLDCLDEQVVHDLNQGARETGREAFATFLARMEASYREQLRDVVALASDDGRRAAAEYVV